MSEREKLVEFLYSLEAEIQQEPDYYARLDLQAQYDDAFERLEEIEEEEA